MDFIIENSILTKYCGNEDEEHIVIPDGVKKIADNVFEGKNNIKSVVFPDGLQEIGEEAFESCNDLESVALPDSVTKLGTRAFFHCYKLSSLRLSKKLTKIPVQCFEQTHIEHVEFPDGLKCIESNAFLGCRRLNSVTVPDSVEEIETNAFFGCGWWDEDNEFELRASIDNTAARHYAHRYDLKFVPVEGNLHDLQEFEIKDGELLCYNGSSETVIIPKKVKSIGQYAFKSNKTMKHVKIPNTVKEIGTDSFEDCINLEEVDIPGSVKTISAYAFMGCKNLKSVKLHRGLLEIGTWAFGNCCSLRGMKVPSTVKEIGHFAIGFEDNGTWKNFYHNFRLDTNGNEAASYYVAWHKLSWTLIRQGR